MQKESPWETVLEKSKTCKIHLLRWKRRVFKRADVEISQLKVRLNFLQNSSSVNWEEVKVVQQRIEQLWREEELYWGQRSRLKWFKGGDRNTKFFHATTLQRRDRNRIQRIQDSHGNWVEGKEDVFKAVLEHFQGVYLAGDISNVENCLQCVPRLVTEEMNRKLMAPVDDEEIKDAVFGLGALKAPGPDGFNGLFFQRNWEILKDDIGRAVKDFFQNGNIKNEVNETIVTLVPKVVLPESINQLRPISCCNFVAKILSKIFVLRLKKFMGSLITQN